VLGIGFIMIAAIFPVAIQQGKLTSEQGSATAVAREALNYLGQIGANSDSIPNNLGGPLFPATGAVGGSAPYLGLVYSMRDPQPYGSVALNTNQTPTSDGELAVTNRPVDEIWNQLNLSLVVPSDQRFAFVGLYRRSGNPADRKTWSPYAQVWFIPVTTRNRSIYSPGSINNSGTLSGVVGPDIYSSASGTQVNLQARLVKVQITDPNGFFTTSGSIGYVLYNYSTAPAGYLPSALSENCYIIIANDESAAMTVDGKPNPDIGRMNGHIYHVGLRRPDLDGSNTIGSYTAYDLAPDGNFTPDVGADGFFGTNPNAAAVSPPLTTDDDVVAIGNTTQAGTQSQIIASGPADAYVIGLDDSGVSSDTGTSQDISAFTTFIKVN
jgi:hypothetical protein